MAKSPARTLRSTARKGRPAAPASAATAKAGINRDANRNLDRASHSVMPETEGLLVAFAHDVRTPLTGILALSDLLATSSLGERERGWVAAIKDAAEHLTDLTTLIVEGARAGAGLPPAQPETFDLPRFGAVLEASLAARAQSKNLGFMADIAADLPAFVRGAPAQLRIALENLAANAVKFTDRGVIGLTIAMAPLPRGRLRLAFAVTDSGIGMTKAEIGRLFRPFAQANRGIASKFGGAGLGLAQTRRLARAMGGDVTVTSMPGRGSTFRLTATVDRVEPPPAGASVSADGGAASARQAGRALRVLCVEDNPHARVLMNAVLQELGYRADFAASGEAAIEALAGGGHDAVLMDITLSGMNGREATRRIRGLPGAAARVIVIGVSGHSGKAEIEAALAAGMDAYLVKPVSPRGLAAELARLRGRAAQDNAAPR